MKLSSLRRRWNPFGTKFSGCFGTSSVGQTQCLETSMEEVSDSVTVKLPCSTNTFEFGDVKSELAPVESFDEELEQEWTWMNGDHDEHDEQDQAEQL